MQLGLCSLQEESRNPHSGLGSREACSTLGKFPSIMFLSCFADRDAGNGGQQSPH